MRSTGINIPGYRLKNGKLVKIDKGSVSQKIRAKRSKRQRVVRRVA